MTWLHHTSSFSLSFIKPLSPSLFSPISSTHTHTDTHTGSQAEWSGYSGWCYSRCGVVEVSMLWPCYPGKKESIRGLPGEEETLYQKHISPWGCITAAIWLQIKRHTYTYTHPHRGLCMHAGVHMFSNVNSIKRKWKTHWRTLSIINRKRSTNTRRGVAKRGKKKHGVSAAKVSKMKSWWKWKIRETHSSFLLRQLLHTFKMWREYRRPWCLHHADSSERCISEPHCRNCKMHHCSWWKHNIQSLWNHSEQFTWYITPVFLLLVLLVEFICTDVHCKSIFLHCFLMFQLNVLIKV